VGAAEIVRLVRVERRVDAAEHDRRASLTCRAPHLVAPQRVPGVDADADDVAALDRRKIERFERFIGDHRVAVAPRRGGREDIQPPRGDDADAEGDMTWIDKMDAHALTTIAD
jgi:hypothetical protein